MSGPAYEIDLYDHDGTFLGELPGAQLTSVDWGLSGIGNIEFNMSQTNSRVGVPILRRHEVALEIEGWPDALERPWQGPLLGCKNDDQNATFSGQSLEYYFTKRYIDFNSLYFDGTTFTADGHGGWTEHAAPTGFTGYDQATIMNGLLDYAQGNANALVGITLANANKNLRIDKSTLISGINRLRKYDRMDHGQISSLMAEFPGLVSYATGAPNGLDYYIKQWQDNHRSMELYYPQRGQVQGNLTAEYGRNVTSFGATEDSTNFANRAICTGGSTGTQKLENEYKDPVSIATYGEDMGIISDGDEKDSTELGSKARAYVQARNHTLVDPDLSMIRMPVELLGVLRPGDTIPISIHRGRVNIETTRRIINIKWQVRPNTIQLTFQPSLGDNS